jgi:ABC-type branched-subunit amino acid transport system ATPase component
VLLDEPCAGVNPSLVEQLRELLASLNKAQGGSFVVIEHNMDFIMRLCPRVICLVEGKVLGYEFDRAGFDRILWDATWGLGLAYRIGLR